MPDLNLARAVLTAMATMGAREAAEKHGVKEHWADRLVRNPSRAVREAPWYPALVKPIKARRAKRRGGRALVVPGARRV